MLKTCRPRGPTRPSSQVFPMGLAGLLFGGFKGEVWIRPGQVGSHEGGMRGLPRSRPTQQAGNVHTHTRSRWMEK